MALVLRKSVLSRNMQLLKCFKGRRALATTAKRQVPLLSAQQAVISPTYPALELSCGTKLSRLVPTRYYAKKKDSCSSKPIGPCGPKEPIPPNDPCRCPSGPCGPCPPIPPLPPCGPSPGTCPCPPFPCPCGSECPNNPKGPSKCPSPKKCKCGAGPTCGIDPAAVVMAISAAGVPIMRERASSMLSRRIKKGSHQNADKKMKISKLVTPRRITRELNTLRLCASCSHIQRTFNRHFSSSAILKAESLTNLIQKRHNSKDCNAGCPCPSPCGPCGCEKGCGCLPPPCNIPPKCLQYMTGYYYYPYGTWFSGPYHVQGVCQPVGKDSPPCPNPASTTAGSTACADKRPKMPCPSGSSQPQVKGTKPVCNSPTTSKCRKPETKPKICGTRPYSTKSDVSEPHHQVHQSYPHFYPSEKACLVKERENAKKLSEPRPRIDTLNPYDP